MEKDWQEIKDETKQKAEHTADTVENKIKKDWQTIKDEVKH